MKLTILPLTPLVTVITSTTANPLLDKVLRSVQSQTHKKIHHLLMVDGPQHHIKVTDSVSQVKQDFPNANIDVVYLPYATGTERFNGHRNLAAGVYLAKGDYICFLDDDNTMDPTHIEDCWKVTNENGNNWSYSLRKIVDKQHNFLCNDDCESLGKWASIINPNDYFIDMNCYFLPKNIALTITPVMHRKFREPGQVEVDRAMIGALKQIGTKFDTTGKYTINYAVGGSALSVAPEFFVRGNALFANEYPNGFPWRR
jgi:glycosyltransferase involved in cell wall biosynthesis